MTDFNFQPLERRMAPVPQQEFSSTLSGLVDLYKQGELINQQAKDLFGLMDVAQGDQLERNRYAEEVDNAMSSLIDEYDGAYESFRFQRDAKNLIRKYAADPRIKAWNQTLNNIKQEDERILQAQFEGRSILDFKPERERRTTVDDQGNYIAYSSGKEMGLDWLKDAENYIGTVNEKTGSIEPDIKGIQGLNFIRQGRYSVVNEKDAIDRANLMLDSFMTSNTGGKQFTRKAAQNLGLDPNDPSIFKNEDVRSEVAGFLEDVAKRQVRSSILYNYNAPQFLNKLEEEPIQDSGYDAVQSIQFDINPTKTLGFDTDDFLTKIRMEGDVASEFSGAVGLAPEAVKRTKQYTGRSSTLTQKEKQQWDRTVRELAPQLLGKQIDPNSKEAEEMMKNYTKTIKEREANPTYVPFTRLGEEGRSAREDATRDIAADVAGRAWFSMEDGKQLDTKDKKALQEEDEEIVVLGEMLPNNYISTIAGNENFASSYYVRKGDKYYTVTKKQSHLDSRVGLKENLTSQLYGEMGLTPGITRETSIKVRGREISITGKVKLEDRKLKVSNINGITIPEQYSTFEDYNHLSEFILELINQQ